MKTPEALTEMVEDLCVSSVRLAVETTGAGADDHAACIVIAVVAGPGGVASSSNCGKDVETERVRVELLEALRDAVRKLEARGA